jgi:hypothetical protein
MRRSFSRAASNNSRMYVFIRCDRQIICTLDRSGGTAF